MSRKILVIGGSAAGPKTAAKAKRTDQHAEVTIVEEGPDLSVSSCGYPYYAGGFFDDRNALLSTPVGVTRDSAYFLKVKGVTARTRTRALSIDRDNHTVRCRDIQKGEEFELAYDKLVIATGAAPVMPPVPGRELEGIITLRTMKDADCLRKAADEKNVKKAVVIGGGLIGVETCEALNLAGIDTALIEMLPQILTFLDIEMAKLVENHMRGKGVQVITGNPLPGFLGKDGRLESVKLKDGTELPCELAVVAVGVRPNVKLAREAGLNIGASNGIEVNEFMQTSDADIYAVGDCVEITHRITGEKVLAPLGDLANLEGRVAGQNVVEGNTATFPGTIQTGVCKVFDYTAGSTGLSEAAALKHGYSVTAAVSSGPDKPHFMAGKLLVIKMVADSKTGRILGMQAVGPGDVSKRIAEAAIAIQGELTVNDLLNADLPYAPPFSPAIDNFIMAAEVLENKMRGRMNGISSIEFKQKLNAGEDIFVLDTRTPGEFDDIRLGVGETLIPCGQVCDRMNELPGDKDKEIIVYCKTSLRAHGVASFLIAEGRRNVKVLEGGVMAWPF